MSGFFSNEQDGEECCILKEEQMDTSTLERTDKLHEAGAAVMWRPVVVEEEAVGWIGAEL